MASWLSEKSYFIILIIVASSRALVYLFLVNFSLGFYPYKRTGVIAAREETFTLEALEQWSVSIPSSVSMFLRCRLADRSHPVEAAAWLVLCLERITLHKLFEKEPFCLYADMGYIFAFGTKPAFAYFLTMGQSVWKKRNHGHCHNRTLNHYWNLGLRVVLNNYLKCWSNEKVKTVSPWKSTKVLIILQPPLLGDSLCLRHISL